MDLPELIAQLATIVPNELLEDAPVNTQNWNNAVKSIKALTAALVELKDRWGCPSIGGKYWRFPGVTIGSEVLEEDPLPQDKWPGTAWRPITTFYANKWFRVEGSRTVAFGNGPQGWALVDHGHDATNDARAGENRNVSYGKGETRKAPERDAVVSVGSPKKTTVDLVIANELRVENFAVQGFQRVS